jgi:hypothetical protein
MLNNGAAIVSCAHGFNQLVALIEADDRRNFNLLVKGGPIGL